MYAQTAPQPETKNIEGLKALEDRIQDAIAKSRKACVHIMLTPGGSMGGSGSGTLISKDGWVCTAGHVNSMQAGIDCIVTLEDGRQFKGVTAGSTPVHDGDYGLIKIDTKGEDVPVAPLGDSDKVVPGQWAIAMGQPLGLVRGRKPVVRVGRILGNGRGMFLVVDAPVVNGDSGGPLFDLDGSLIAFTSNGNPDDPSINQFSRINGLVALMDRLKNNEIIGGPAGGQAAQQPTTLPGLTQEETDQYNRGTEHLLSGDYLAAIEEFKPLLEKESQAVLYNAACAYSLLSAQTEKKAEKESHAAEAVKLLVRAVEAGWLNLDHMRSDKDLNPLRERADYLECERTLYRKIFKPLFGLEVEQKDMGVVVTTVLDDSPAEFIGIRKGDVIRKIGYAAIGDMTDYANAIANVDRMTQTTFDVYRDGQELTLRCEPLLADPNMSPTDTFDEAVSKQSQEILGLWNGRTESLAPAVFQIEHEGKNVAFATAVAKDGYLVTKASEVAKLEGIVAIDDDGTEHAANVVAQDEESDLALIKIEATLEHIVEFSGIADPEIGALLVTVDADGDAITYGASALDHFDSSGEKNRGFLGVNLEVCETGGLTFTNVVEGSAANKAGIKVGDVVLVLDRRPVSTVQEFYDAIITRKIGDVVTMQGYSGDESKTWTATLTGQIANPSQSAPSQGQTQPSGPQFGVALKAREDGNGLDVKEVKPGSPADQLGIKAGEILMRANGKPLKTLEDFQKAKDESMAAGMIRLRVKSIDADGKETVRPVAGRLQARGGHPGGGYPGGPVPGPAPQQQNPYLRILGPHNERNMDFGEVIQHDALLKPDQVGSPIVDLDGNVRGLNISRTDRVRNFALSSARVNEIVTKLLAEAKQGE